jgi:alkylresorcinol/alkylpyrone synthase
MARAADYLRAFPAQIAVLLSVELCSLTLQREDLSIPNMISTGLFGDGAAAVVLGDANRRRAPAPRVLTSRTILYPNTERVMGWDFVESGFKVVLSAQVPQMVREHLRADVDAFLADNGLDRSHLRHIVCHTGGPKVLEAVTESLELAPDALARSWASLQSVGNLSSASVLFVLGDLLASDEAREGDRGLLVAMGPAFGCELILLQW